MIFISIKPMSQLPFEALQSSIESRKLELDFLMSHFGIALEIVLDHERLNGIIEASPRPDLVLADPAEQMQIAYPYRPGDINNFVPGMRAFGPRVFIDKKNARTGEVESQSYGRRPPTETELETYFFMGARGDYHQHHAFAKEHGVDEDTAYDTILMNHVNKPAFMRMWIAAPELTRHLMATCLDDRTKPKTQYYEEIFVAYSIMSQLVDKKDSNVERNENGKIFFDDWYLCR